MNVEVKAAAAEDKSVLQRLMQFYIYDFSEFLPLEWSRVGVFEERLSERFFVEEGKWPYLVFVDGQLTGFVLVTAEPVLSEHVGGRCMKEFFIARRYRRRGIGAQAAAQVFALFPGVWEVKVVRANPAARRFWGAAIGAYTAHDFCETERNDEVWDGWVFSFDK